ncbi:MAG: hypothetical protein NC548_38810 [Lachnospiraceae bacterium]|nr:hypothetical protein [Lachnospiraceae bacterium]
MDELEKLERQYRLEAAKEERQYRLIVKGREAEKIGDLYGAIKTYNLLVKQEYDGTTPYDRLCIIYRKQGKYQQEYDVLQKAIALFIRLSKTSPREDILPKLEKFKERKEKLLKLAAKKGVPIDV